jgi:hypothetical protein
MIRLLVIAGMTVIGAALASGVASAAVTTSVDGKALTVTSDAKPDPIVLEVRNGFIAVNNVATTLARHGHPTVRAHLSL